MIAILLTLNLHWVACMVLLTFDFMNKITQTVRFFDAFIMLYELVLSLNCMNKILKFHDSNESYYTEPSSDTAEYSKSSLCVSC